MHVFSTILSIDPTRPSKQPLSVLPHREGVRRKIYSINQPDWNPPPRNTGASGIPQVEASGRLPLQARPQDGLHSGGGHCQGREDQGRSFERPPIGGRNLMLRSSSENHTLGVQFSINFRASFLQ